MRNLKSWTDLIDHQLVEWGHDPSQLKDDESEPPTPTTISRAVELASLLRDSHWPPPTRIVSTGNAEIRFQFDHGRRFTSIVVSNDSAPELLVFEGGRLTYRGPIEPHDLGKLSRSDSIARDELLVPLLDLLAGCGILAP